MSWWRCHRARLVEWVVYVVKRVFTHLPHSVSHTFMHLLASPDELAPFWKLCSYSHTNIFLAQLSPSLYLSSSFQTNTRANTPHFTHLAQTFKFQFPWNSFHRFPFTPNLRFPSFSFELFFLTPNGLIQPHRHALDTPRHLLGTPS